MSTCSHCLSAYPDQVSLLFHLKIHPTHRPLGLDLNPTRPLNVRCAHCKQIFYSMDKVRTHLRELGPATLRKYDPQKVIAQFCIEEVKKLKMSDPVPNPRRFFNYNGETWTIVEDSPQEFALLKALVHDRSSLKRGGIVTRATTTDQLRSLRKCRNCGLQYKNIEDPKACKMHTGTVHTEFSAIIGRNIKVGGYTCCGAPFSEPSKRKDDGCTLLGPHALEPLAEVSPKYLYLQAPDAIKPRRAYKAVALDCEMGSTYAGDHELIQICAVDYFTGKTLINSLVKPSVPLMSYNTQWSGVTSEAMDDAIRSGKALDGWTGARAELWKFMDAETILVGHALKNDLTSLRMAHAVLVDSDLAIPKVPGQSHGLKSLCSEYLGKSIQGGAGSKGHDCLEDALSARELIIWCLGNSKKLEQRAMEAATEIARRAQLKLKNHQQKVKMQSSQSGITPSTVADLAEIDPNWEKKGKWDQEDQENKQY